MGLAVALFIGVGLITGFLGLIITLPLIGHATWHAYQDLTGQADASTDAEAAPASGG